MIEPYETKTVRDGATLGSIVPIPIAVHPNYSGRNVVIMYPGYSVSSNLDGYNNKYKKLAEEIVERNIGAVIRMQNNPINGIPYHKSVVENLRYVIDYVLEESRSICKGSPNIYLMGNSAGASAVAAVCASYSHVSKVLLIAPSGDAGPAANKLSRFEGEVYITVGENDEIVGEQSGHHFFNLATSASRRTLKIIPGCDHQFKGTRNGKIFSKAPFWAFAGDETFPSPEGGIVLY